MTDKNVGGVGVELEAAEALAALSHHISSVEDQSGKFSQPFRNTNESLTTPHDRLKIPWKNNNTISSMVMPSERAEQEVNRMNYRVLGSVFCIKSRNHLSEDEKEQRRIRRILANRESARQTIRRRQAMYEQLTKNAALFETENENLKSEKEKALSKYSSLKNMNEHLKDMLDKAAKAEAIREQCGDPDSGPIMPSTSSTSPTLPSLVPFFGPPFFQSSNGDSEQGMQESNGMGAPVYVLPFPWFFPVHMQCIAQSSQPPIQYIQCRYIQNEACTNVGCSAGSFSQAEGHMEKRHASNAPNMNAEITHVTMSANQDCGLGVAPDGTGKQTAEEPQEDDMVEMEAVSPSAWGLATKSEVPIPCASNKSADAAAAAEARRKRKELTN